MNNKVLKKGYTTGAHTSWAFRSALSVFLQVQEYTSSKTNKIDNDDLDVTKGCEIVVCLSYDKKDLQINKIKHKPCILKSINNILEIYAGIGVGVVTKDGLKVQKNYPAINPIPLDSLKYIFKKIVNQNQKSKIYCSISVTNGEELAKKTANSKVGVLGGISILGTTGWVKPISATAYLASINQEINFIKANYITPIVLSIGNSSFDMAKQNYKEQQIVQIGNFVYDALKLCDNLKLYEVVLICGIGKMTKISQGFKNTHNRFGSIDFKKIQDEVKEKLDFEIDINSTKTVKGVSLQLEKVGLDKIFYENIKINSSKQINQWFSNINIELVLV